MFYVSTIRTNRLTLHYSYLLTYGGNPFKIALNGYNVTQLSSFSTSWASYTIDISLITIGNEKLLFKGTKAGTQTAINTVSVVLLGGETGMTGSTGSTCSTSLTGSKSLTRPTGISPPPQDALLDLIQKLVYMESVWCYTNIYLMIPKAIQQER